MIEYVLITSLLIGVFAMKAVIAYLVVKISIEFNISNPFGSKVHKLIEKISYWAFFTGVLAILATVYSKHLVTKGISIPIDWSAGEIFFFGNIIFIIAQVFKKGIELQTENELTV
jgi:hypothetical protein